MAMTTLRDWLRDVLRPAACSWLFTHDVQFTLMDILPGLNWPAGGDDTYVFTVWEGEDYWHRGIKIDAPDLGVAMRTMHVLRDEMQQCGIKRWKRRHDTDASGAVGLHVNRVLLVETREEEDGSISYNTASNHGAW